jgi:hypothetical protein
MSSLPRKLILAFLSATLIPTFFIGEAHAQCKRGSQGTNGSRQASAVSAQLQANALQSLLSQGASLQGNLSLCGTVQLQGNLNLSGNLQLGGNLNLSQAALQLQGNVSSQQAALQAAFQKTTALLNAAQQQGLSASQIGQLTARQQRIAALLSALQQ